MSKKNDIAATEEKPPKTDGFAWQEKPNAPKKEVERKKEQSMTYNLRVTSGLRRLLKAHGDPLGITPRKKKEKDPKIEPQKTLAQDRLTFMLSDPEELKLFL